MYEWLESKRTNDWKEEQKETIKIEGMANGDKLVPYEKSRFLYPIYRFYVVK